MFEDQEEYWNSVATKKEFTTPFKLDEFINYIAVDQPVLDLGCGYGRTLAELENAGFTNIWGCDFSQKMIDRGIVQHPELNLVKNVNGKLPFEDNTFDAVLSLAVLTCITTNIEQYRLIEEIKRVLTDDGILYINDFLLNTDKRNIDRYDEFKEKYGYGSFEIPEGAIVRHHTMDHISELTKDFEEQVFEPVTYTTMNKNQANGFYYIGKLISK